MSATSIDTAFPSDEPPHGRTPPTTDLDMTTDLHEQNTSGLEPTTVETTIDTKSSPAESAVCDENSLIDNSRAAVVSPEAGSAPEARSPALIWGAGRISGALVIGLPRRCSSWREAATSLSSSKSSNCWSALERSLGSTYRGDDLSAVLTIAADDCTDVRCAGSRWGS